MIIKDRNSTDYLELHILGFEFEDSECLNEYDREWLMVSMTASKSNRVWSATQSVLQYSDAKYLAEWFRVIARGKEPRRRGYYGRDIWFTEPNISFKLRGRPRINPVIRVYFDQEYLPDWSPETAGECEYQSFYIDVRTDAQTLMEASRSLLEELSRLPERSC